MHHQLKFSTPLLAALLVLVFGLPASARSKTAPPPKLLPEKVGDFKASGRQVVAAPAGGDSTRFEPADFEVGLAAEREYAGANGERIVVRAIQTASPSAAYSLLSHLSAAEGAGRVRVLEGAGVVGHEGAGRVRFIKGAVLAEVRVDGGQPDAARAFAAQYAAALAGEAGFVPILLMHLPEWEKKVDEEVGYAVTLPALRRFAGNRPALDALSFEGGAEAATAAYGESRLVLVEFPTPQLSIDNDARIVERVAQLRAAGQPAPSFYKRVGNYSVFVFDAPGEAAAQKLASGVSYEKDVRWLGRSPHEDEIIQRIYTQTMGGVIVTTLATTGVAILVCLGVGGLIGGAVFMYRRTRPGAREAYSDAGGMMRLNLEDFDASKLLGPKKD